MPTACGPPCSRTDGGEYVRRLQRRVRRTRQGNYQLRLPEVERQILRSLPGRLRDLLASDDPALGRLFPPAYGDDVERNAEYERLVRGDLVDGKTTAIDVMEATIDADRVDEEQLLAWLGAINDLRLVLGTKLDVREEAVPEVAQDDPLSTSYALYYYLSWLEEQVVEELASGVDPAGTSTE
jgi:Domain of unknown function (DUF2017)